MATEGNRCEDHAQARYREARSRRRMLPSHKAYNTARWKRTRKRVLDRDGHRCTLCRSDGNGQPLHVDHRDGLGMEGPRAYDETNLRTLCRPCHSRKTVQEDGGFGHNPKRQVQR